MISQEQFQKEIDYIIRNAVREDVGMATTVPWPVFPMTRGARPNYW